MMKKILIALAGVAVLAAPLAAQARPAVVHGGGGFHGGGVHGGGVHGGGFYRGGFYGYPGYYYGAAGLGFALGASLADPWYYGPAYYGYYGYYGPPAPVIYADPAYGYAPPPVSGPAPQAACGQWSWDQANAKYNWIPGSCAPAAVAPPAGTD
jgi:hypothetical protein